MGVWKFEVRRNFLAFRTDEMDREVLLPCPRPSLRF
jgi:hypothetical protein